MVGWVGVGTGGGGNGRVWCGWVGGCVCVCGGGGGGGGGRGAGGGNLYRRCQRRCFLIAMHAAEHSFCSLATSRSLTSPAALPCIIPAPPVRQHDRQRRRQRAAPGARGSGGGGGRSAGGALRPAPLVSRGSARGAGCCGGSLRGRLCLPGLAARGAALRGRGGWARVDGGACPPLQRCPSGPWLASVCPQASLHNGPLFSALFIQIYPSSCRWWWWAACCCRRLPRTGTCWAGGCAPGAATGRRPRDSTPRPQALHVLAWRGLCPLHLLARATSCALLCTCCGLFYLQYCTVRI